MQISQLQHTSSQTPSSSTRGVLSHNFIKITLRHGCSPANLQHIFRTTVYQNVYGGLLLRSQSITSHPHTFPGTGVQLLAVIVYCSYDFWAKKEKGRIKKDSSSKLKCELKIPCCFCHSKWGWVWIFCQSIQYELSSCCWPADGHPM